MSKVHRTAVIEPGAVVGEDCDIGPYAIVGARAVLGRRCVLAPHAVVLGDTSLGDDNQVGPFAVIGGSPQDKRHGDAPTKLVVGSNNVFREHVTVHVGTRETHTRVGDGNLLMVGAHVAHDATVGSFTVIANGAQIAGHAHIEDHVVMGGLAGIAQFVRVGEGTFVAAGAMVERDLPPLVIAQGDRARVRAVNVVGLKRRGIDPASLAEVERVFRVIYIQKGARAARLATLATSDPWAQKLLDAIRA